MVSACLFALLLAGLTGALWVSRFGRCPHSGLRHGVGPLLGALALLALARRTALPPETLALGLALPFPLLLLIPSPTKSHGVWNWLGMLPVALVGAVVAALHPIGRLDPMLEGWLPLDADPLRAAWAVQALLAGLTSLAAAGYLVSAGAGMGAGLAAALAGALATPAGLELAAARLTVLAAGLWWLRRRPDSSRLGACLLAGLCLAVQDQSGLLAGLVALALGLVVRRGHGGPEFVGAALLGALVVLTGPPEPPLVPAWSMNLWVLVALSGLGLLILTKQSGPVLSARPPGPPDGAEPTALPGARPPGPENSGTGNTEFAVPGARIAQSPEATAPATPDGAGPAPPAPSDGTTALAEPTAPGGTESTATAPGGAEPGGLPWPAAPLLVATGLWPAATPQAALLLLVAQASRWRWRAWLWVALVVLAGVGQTLTWPRLASDPRERVQAYLAVHSVPGDRGLLLGVAHPDEWDDERLPQRFWLARPELSRAFLETARLDLLWGARVAWVVVDQAVLSPSLRAGLERDSTLPGPTFGPYQLFQVRTFGHTYWSEPPFRSQVRLPAGPLRAGQYYPVQLTIANGSGIPRCLGWVRLDVQTESGRSVGVPLDLLAGRGRLAAGAGDIITLPLVTPPHPGTYWLQVELPLTVAARPVVLDRREVRIEP